MKKHIAFLFALVLIITSFTTINASTSSVKILLNGDVLTLEKDALIEKGRTLVPAKTLAEKLGATITTTENTILIDAPYLSIEFNLGESAALVHRKFDFTGIPQKADLEVKAKIVDGIAFVPLRFVAETLDANVRWDGVERTINILSKDFVEKAKTNKTLEFSVIDPTIVRMTAELSEWFYSNTEIAGVSYKTIEGTTYIKVNAGQKPTGGYSLDVNGVYDLGGGKLLVDTTLLKPAPDMMVIQVITYPTVLLSVTTTDSVNQVLGITTEGFAELAIN